MNYAQAKDWYKHRDPYVGCQLSRYVYFKYDPKEDCFVVKQLMSKYQYVPDPEPDNVENKKYAVHKSLWQFRPFAKIYKDRTEVFFEAPSKCTEAIGLSHFKPGSKKLSGRLWRYHGCPDVQGELPVIIRNGKLTVTPPKVRMTDREKRIEMNRMIQKIRKLLTVRTKIGAFKNVTHEVVKAHAGKHGIARRWQIMNNPAEFLKLMNAVDESDITTFYPLLYLAEQVSWYTAHNKINDEGSWVQYFNKLVDSMRERMRTELGVVTYVEPEVAKAA